RAPGLRVGEEERIARRIGPATVDEETLPVDALEAAPARLGGLARQIAQWVQPRQDAAHDEATGADDAEELVERAALVARRGQVVEGAGDERGVEGAVG